MQNQRAYASVAIISGLTAGCSLIAKPEIRDIRANVRNIDLEGIALVFDVDVYNPYALTIHTPEFRYGLDIDDNEFIKAEESTRIDLPALQVGTLHMPAHINYLGLWQAYQGLEGSNEIKYRLHGTVLVKTLEQSFELPVSYRGTFPVFRLPSFSTPEVSFSDVSLTGAKVLIQTDISNPNVFGIGLKGLSLDVQLGDVRVGGIRPLALENLDANASSRLSIVGEVNAANALTRVLGGQSLGKPRIRCQGTLETPYGSVPLEN